MDAPDVQKLDRNEQKWILGGYSGSSKCYWESTTDSGCTDDPLHAYFMGTYYWCCNCSAASSNCTKKD